MGERTNRKLPSRVLLSLIAALLLAFVSGYIGISGFGGEPIGVEKASAYPGNPYVEDIAHFRQRFAQVVQFAQNAHLHAVQTLWHSQRPVTVGVEGATIVRRGIFANFGKRLARLR